MRSRNLAFLFAAALTLGACASGGDGDVSESSSPSDTPSESGSATPGPADAGSDPAAEQLPTVSEDLPDGVAATVAGQDIEVAVVEARFALVSELPQVAEQLADDDGTVEAQINGTILGQLVVRSLVLHGAQQEGVEISDDEVAAERSRLAEEAGGPEAFAAQTAEAGIPEDQLDEELRASLAFTQVVDGLLADAGVEPAGPDAPTQDPAAAQIQQEWLLALVQGGDVVVDESMGAWDPNTGQVVPA